MIEKKIVAPKHRSSWMTPAQCLAYYKVRYQFREIQIHHWGDPKTKPTHAGVVKYIANKTGGSVNYVASAGKITQMVNEENCAITTYTGNPYGIKIECSPYCTGGDYDTIAWLIADIRRRRGNLPLVPHSKYWNTECPGAWDLKKLSALANKKLKSEETEMLTTKGYTELKRFYHGMNPSTSQLKRSVGKITHAEMTKLLTASPIYKSRIAQAKDGTLDFRSHLPKEIRDAYQEKGIAGFKAKITNFLKGVK
jgi:uncharacterized glyoxalase superfamily protein PhnB